ncbi:MAG: hypothetical protein R3C53_03425 [Pirellulaceae bacterium]
MLPILARQLIEDLIEQLRSERPDYRGLPSKFANNHNRQPLIGFETAAFVSRPACDTHRDRRCSYDGARDQHSPTTI